jgi:hypothetical protein
MTSAGRQALQQRGGLAVVAEWEKQHGFFSAEEMDEARRNVVRASDREVAVVAVRCGCRFSVQIMCE